MTVTELNHALKAILRRSLSEITTLIEAHATDLKGPLDLSAVLGSFFTESMARGMTLVDQHSPGKTNYLYASIIESANCARRKEIESRWGSTLKPDQSECVAVMNEVTEVLVTTLLTLFDTLPPAFRCYHMLLRAAELLLLHMLDKFAHPHELLDHCCEKLHKALDAVRPDKSLFEEEAAMAANSH